MGEETARHDYREEEKQPRDLARSVTLCIPLKKILYILLVIALVLGLVAFTTLFLLEKNKVEEQELSLRVQVSNLQENNNNVSEENQVLKEELSGFQEKLGNLSEQNQVLKEELSGLQEQIGNLTEWEKILRLEVSSLREKNANLSNKEQLLQKQMNSQQEKLQNCKGCPDVWVPLENNCYLFSNATATFSEAQRVCARDSAYILEDLSPEEKSFTKSRASTTMWIGATDKLQEGVYVYESTGSIVTDGPWWVGEPGGGRDENCVVAQKMNNWRWDDYPCHFKFHYVCKKTITSTRKLNKTLD